MFSASPKEKGRQLLEARHTHKYNPPPGAPPYAGMVNADWACGSVESLIGEAERLEGWLMLLAGLPDDRLADRKAMVRDALEGLPVPSSSRSADNA